MVFFFSISVTSFFFLFQILGEQVKLNDGRILISFYGIKIKIHFENTLTALLMTVNILLSPSTRNSFRTLLNFSRHLYICSFIFIYSSVLIFYSLWILETVNQLCQNDLLYGIFSRWQTARKTRLNLFYYLLNRIESIWLKYDLAIHF